MKNLGLEFKVGLFTILGLVATGSLIWFIEPDRFESASNNSYYTILSDATGVFAKTHVKTNGVTVGKVVSVQLLSEESRARVEFEVDANVKLPVGSQLDIRTVGLLGDKHIEILRSEAAPDGFIPEGGFVPRASGGVEINELVKIFGDIGRDVKAITQSLAGTIGGRTGQDKLTNILDNIEAIVENTNAVLVDNRSDLRTAMNNMREVSEVLKSIISDTNRDKINRIIAAFDDSMNEVQGATRSIRLISDKIEQGEGTIGKLVNNDDTITELQSAIKDIREIMAPATKMAIGVDYHMEGRKDKTSTNYFNIKLQTRPDRYYLLGVADADYAVEDTTTVAGTPEDKDELAGGSRETKYIDKKGQLRINLQMAKRWYDAQLRFGLFESEGGLAFDYYTWRDQLTFSLEAFDWKLTKNDERRVARVKAYMSILFFNHIYAMVGVDDITRIEDGEPAKDPNLFAGAGFRFTDSDLKAVFGTAALAL